MNQFLPSVPRLRLLVPIIGSLLLVLMAGRSVGAETQVLIVVGPSNHAPGTHEVAVVLGEVIRSAGVPPAGGV